MDQAIARSVGFQVPHAVAAGTVAVEHAIRDFVVASGISKHVFAAQTAAVRTVEAGAFGAVAVPDQGDRRGRHWIACLIGNSSLCTELRAKQNGIEKLLAPEAQGCTKERQLRP